MPTTKKLDLYRKHASEYVAPREPTLVKIGPAKYLAITGRGQGGGPLFQQQIGALYSMAFTIKMASKFERGRDYAVNKLEGLWWGRAPLRSKRGAANPSKGGSPEIWSWRLLLRVPEFIGGREQKSAQSTLAARGKDPMFREVKLETIREGTCVQVLHLGSYHEEQPTIARMLAFAKAKGMRKHGRHHEIYLSDPRRVPIEKLRTILRQPVR